MSIDNFWTKKYKYKEFIMSVCVYIKPYEISLKFLLSFFFSLVIFCLCFLILCQFLYNIAKMLIYLYLDVKLANTWNCKHMKLWIEMLTLLTKISNLIGLNTTSFSILLLWFILIPIYLKCLFSIYIFNFKFILISLITNSLCIFNFGST